MTDGSVCRNRALARLLMPLIVLACLAQAQGDTSDEALPQGKTTERAVVRREPAPLRLGYAYFGERMVGHWSGLGFVPRVRRDFQRDLPIMASLGAPAVKLAVLPVMYGLEVAQDGGAHWNQPVLDASTRNLIEVIRACAEHGMPVVVTFMINDYYLRGPNGYIPNNKPNWFEHGYRHMGLDEGARAMGTDFARFVNIFIDAIEASGLGPCVMYYNVFTEAHYSYNAEAAQVTSGIVRALLAGVRVPEGKLGIDAYPVGSVRLLAEDLAAAGKHADFTEVHKYPDSAPHEVLTDEVTETRLHFPGAEILLGEVGSPFCQVGEDGLRQRDSLARVIAEAEPLELGIGFNWGFWDAATDCDCGPASNDSMRWGIGFNPNQPRPLVGWLVEQQSALPGGDFEDGISGWTLTQGWGASDRGTPVRVMHMNSADAMPAATGQGFMRLVSTGECDASLTSPAFALDGHTLAVSGYLRASAGDVYLAVDYLDAVGWSDETDRRPAAEQRIAVSPDEQMHQIQQVLGGMVFPLPPAAKAARLRFVLYSPEGTGADNPATLDLDAVSVNSFDPIPAH